MSSRSFFFAIFNANVRAAVASRSRREATARETDPCLKRPGQLEQSMLRFLAHSVL